MGPRYQPTEDRFDMAVSMIVYDGGRPKFASLLGHEASRSSLEWFMSEASALFEVVAAVSEVATVGDSGSRSLLGRLWPVTLLISLASQGCCEHKRGVVPHWSP